jgi:hypothetical protein
MLDVEKKQKSSEDTTECDATHKIDHQTSKQLLIRHVHSQSVMRGRERQPCGLVPTKVLDLLPARLICATRTGHKRKVRLPAQDRWRSISQCSTSLIAKTSRTIESSSLRARLIPPVMRADMRCCYRCSPQSWRRTITFAGLRRIIVRHIHDADTGRNAQCPFTGADRKSPWPGQTDANDPKLTWGSTSVRSASDTIAHMPSWRAI